MDFFCSSDVMNVMVTPVRESEILQKGAVIQDSDQVCRKRTYAIR